MDTLAKLTQSVESCVALNKESLIDGHKHPFANLKHPFASHSIKKV